MGTVESAALGLDERHWDTFPHQVKRHRMPKSMWMHSLLDPSLRPETVQERADIGSVQGFSVESAEQTRTPVDAHGASLVSPSHDDGHRTLVESDDPLAVSLAVKNGDRSGVGPVTGCNLDGAPYGALVASIGGTVFVVGGSYIGTAPPSGEILPAGDDSLGFHFDSRARFGTQIRTD
jgi:hypothetical protein